MIFQTCLGRGITIGSLRIGTAVQDIFPVGVKYVHSHLKTHKKVQVGKDQEN